jgi:hypothetical protein
VVDIVYAQNWTEFYCKKVPELLTAPALLEGFYSLSFPPLTLQLIGSRYRNDPNYSFRDIGFRVAVSPAQRPAGA